METINNLECVSAKKLADILGLSYWTIRNYTKQGIIPAVKIGKSVRYNVQQVQNALFSKESNQ